MRVYYGTPKPAPEGWLFVAWAGTKQYKDELKALGCGFYGLDPEGNDRKGYYSPPENHAEAVALLPDPTDMAKWTPVKGNIFDVRDVLKDKYGARCIWVVPNEKHKEAQEFANAISS